MWMIMALEQPMITSVIARMDNATIQLAAFGVAFSMALFIEGSIIQMLAAGTAISNSRENYRRLLMLMHIIGITATAIHAALCIPGVFYPLASVILGLPEELISPSRRAFLIMLPWTIAVGYRRLWQGVLIHYGRTRVIPISMTIRILFLITALRLSLSTGWFSGAAAGAIGLLAGVSTGALATWFYVRPVINRMPSIMNGNGGEVIRWDTLIKFYVPLALTSFINLGIRPVMQMGMSRGAFPLESLAIWPVFMGYMFLYNSLSLASQEVVIAQIGGSVSNRKLIRFISGLAVTLMSYCQ